MKGQQRPGIKTFAKGHDTKALTSKLSSTVVCVRASDGMFVEKRGLPRAGEFQALRRLGDDCRLSTKAMGNSGGDIR